MNRVSELKPFGTFAPTPLQMKIIEISRSSFLNRGIFRDALLRLVLAIRPGPIDCRRQGADFRLHFEGNGTEIGILLKSEYDPQEISFLAEAARGGIFVDVGANAGAYTLLVTAACDRDCKVIAIEPLPELLQPLHENLVINALSNVTVIEHAAGETEGTLSLNVNRTNLGASRINAGGGWQSGSVRSWIS